MKVDLNGISRCELREDDDESPSVRHVVQSSQRIDDRMASATEYIRGRSENTLHAGFLVTCAADVAAFPESW